MKVYKPLTIEKCREILGKEAEGLTDAEIEKIRDSLAGKFEKLYSDQS